MQALAAERTGARTGIAYPRGLAMPATADVTVHVPPQLRAHTGGVADVALPLSAAPTVGDALCELERRHPGLHHGVCDDTGAVRRHVNLFVNSAHIRDLAGLDTPLAPGDTLAIFPAVSGG
jgi:molybdopterin converting factor small subunit